MEEAFELQAELPEVVRTGIWVGDCFVYNNAAWRLNYCVGGEVTTLYHLDRCGGGGGVAAVRCVGRRRRGV